MPDPILALSDSWAERILTTMARARGGPAEVMPGLREALAEEFGAPAGQTVSRGDLARQALLLLAEEPASRREIEEMAEHPPSPTQLFDGGASFALTAAVLFVLQTQIDIERGKDGKWSFKFKKKAASGGLVKPLVEKLISFLKSSAL